MADFVATARRVVEQSIRTAYPNATPEQAELQSVSFALGQARMYALSDRFGPDHDMTQAYRELAEELSTPIHSTIKNLVEKSLN